MKQFSKKTMSVKFYFTCINEDYFNNHYRAYYDFMAFASSRSKAHGFYVKSYFKIKTMSDILSLGLDKKTYYELPTYVCSSVIY